MFHFVPLYNNKSSKKSSDIYKLIMYLIEKVNALKLCTERKIKFKMQIRMH